MSNVMTINSADKALAKQIHKLNKNQLKEAEKLYYRSSFTWLKACKIIRDKK